MRTHSPPLELSAALLRGCTSSAGMRCESDVPSMWISESKPTAATDCFNASKKTEVTLRCQNNHVIGLLLGVDSTCETHSTAAASRMQLQFLPSQTWKYSDREIVVICHVHKKLGQVGKPNPMICLSTGAKKSHGKKYCFSIKLGPRLGTAWPLLSPEVRFPRRKTRSLKLHQSIYSIVLEFPWNILKPILWKPHQVTF